MAHQSTALQPALVPTVVSLHEVFRLQDCKVVRDQVLNLRQYWKTRSEVGSFFTLGAASYLDAVERRDVYLEEAHKFNSMLRSNFDWLYERIRKGFEGVLGQPVSYDSECALPGFHIFVHEGADQSNDRPSSRAHFDMQWIHAMPGRRPEETLSFTLPIEEPMGGSSLEIWPIHADAIQPGLDIRKYAANRPSQTLRYERGRMVVHDGLLLHAIGCASIATPKGYRITFQGHGAKVSGSWKFYW
jgi:hypothetical protein